MAEEKKRSKEQPETVKEWVTAKGWKFRLEGENYKAEVCPYCGNDKFNFEIHKERGMGKCWACGTSCSFYNLRKHVDGVAPRPKVGKVDKDEEVKMTPERMEELTDAVEGFHKKIWIREEALTYVKGRGFTEETISHFKLGAQKVKGNLWLVIPHMEGEKAVNIKYRNLHGGKPKWRQEKEAKRVLFNNSAMEEFDESIIIVEGELKAVALWQVGIKNVVGLPQGVDTFLPEWVDQLEKFNKIYLCLDTDVAGQGAAKKLGLRLGMNRCYNIVLTDDAKDPDEWLFEKGHTAEEFEQLMRKAKLMDIQNIVAANNAFTFLADIMELEDTGAFQGLKTRWPTVNQVVRGFMPGNLIVITAPAKVGKTSWALDMSIGWAQENIPGLFYCMEMGPDMMAKKITSNILSRDDELITRDDVILARQMFKKYPFYMADSVKASEPKAIFDTIRAAYKRYGLQWVVFDNLHFLVRGTENVREKVGEVSQGFKLLAEELRIPVFLIVHPRKLKGNGPATSDDLKESSAIHADSDMVIVLHRKRLGAKDQDDDTGILSNETEIIVDAHRYGPGGKAVLTYHGAKTKFTED